MAKNIIKTICILIITYFTISCGSSSSDETVSFSNNLEMRLTFKGSCDKSFFIPKKRASDYPNYQEIDYTCKNLILDSSAACLITAELNESSGNPAVGALLKIETDSYGSDAPYPMIQGQTDINGNFPFSLSLSDLCGYGSGGRSNITTITASTSENEPLPTRIEIYAPDDGF